MLRLNWLLFLFVFAGANVWSKEEVKLLKEGDSMPPFSFVDQEGKKHSLQEFPGRPVVLTFFFTRCPQPEFCPAMNQRFHQVRDDLKKEKKISLQLVSLSFDPETDQPEVLKSYAENHGIHGSDWYFASADPSEIREFGKKFGFEFWPDQTVYDHNLRTLVIDSQGRLFQIFKGNQWTSKQLLEAVRKAAAVQ